MFEVRGRQGKWHYGSRVWRVWVREVSRLCAAAGLAVALTLSWREMEQPNRIFIYTR